MKHKINLTFLQSMIVMPLMAMSIAQATPGSATILTEVNAQNQVPVLSEADMRERADIAAKIDTYLSDRNMPLAGYGAKMVEVAYENDLDPYLIPAIAVRESTGGKFACKTHDNNYWGWASCKVGFETMDVAIEKIGQHLGGNHPKTSSYYKDKDVKGILRTYNPPSVVPQYANQVMSIMTKIKNVQA